MDGPDVIAPYTLPEAPPPRRRRSLWAEVFAEARNYPNAWLRVLRPLSRSTAQQLASDIRRSHRRNGKGVARAVLDGERWDATWGEVEGEHFVWIRLVVEDGPEGQAALRAGPGR